MTKEILCFIADILATLKTVNPILLGIITIVVAFILYIMIGINKRSLKNIKKRFEIYEKIIMNVDNKLLSYTYLKEYLGCPISNDMVKYMLESKYFYELVTIWKNIYTLVDYDPKTKKIKYKECRKLIGILFAIISFILLLPFLAFLILLAKNSISSGYLIPLFMITISCAIVAVFFFLIECSNILMAGKLMKNLDKEEPSTVPIT